MSKPFKHPRDLLDLQTAVHQLPVEHQHKIQFALDRHIKSSARRWRILQLVQEALAQLRLDMKYLFFDLECTRKERDEARRTA
jgi:hypothetical protein